MMQDNGEFENCTLLNIVTSQLSELVARTDVNTEMCNRLKQDNIITRQTHRKLLHDPDAATYLYNDIVPMFAGDESSELKFMEALKIGGNLAALKIIQDSKNSCEQTGSQITTSASFHVPDSRQLHGLPEENTRFIGRTSELEMLKDMCKLKTYEKRRPVLVSGLGGIGKTGLVRKHVAEFVQQNQTPIVIWMNGTEGKLQESIHSLLKVYSNLRNYTDKTKMKYVLGNFIKFLSETGRSVLLVIDNLELVCDSVHFLFDKTLPIPVIVTSRNRQILEGNNCLLQLAGLNPTDSDLLLESVLEYEDPRSSVLCNTLQYLPLSILECANYIKKMKILHTYDVALFLDEFHGLKVKLDVLKNNFPVAWKDSYDSTTFSTFDKTIRLIMEESSNTTFKFMPVLLLKILSFGKSTDIMESWLYQISGLHMLTKQGLWESMHIEEQNQSCRQLQGKSFRRDSHKYTDKDLKNKDLKSSLRKLLRFSLIEYEIKEGKPYYNIHQMLQTVTRLKYEDKDWNPPSEFISKNSEAYDNLKWSFAKTNTHFFRRILKPVMNWSRIFPRNG